MTTSLELGRLRIFPLAQVVLFPDLSVPLYIFEPRYRAMTRDALADDQMIGMIVVTPQNAEAMAGNPPTFDVGCAGRIAQHQERPDGTFAIVLDATQRFRIVHEDSGNALYRTAEVEYLTEADSSAHTGAHPSGHEARRREIRVALDHLIRPTQSKRVDAAQAALDQLDALDDARFVNTLAQQIDFDVLEKQRLLESDGTANRYDVLAELMQFRLAEALGGGGPGSGTVH
jgi:Lon protease-like protein